MNLFTGFLLRNVLKRVSIDFLFCFVFTLLSGDFIIQKSKILHNLDLRFRFKVNVSP